MTNREVMAHLLNELDGATLAPGATAGAIRLAAFNRVKEYSLVLADVVDALETSGVRDIIMEEKAG